LARPRVHHGGAPDLLYYEEGIARDILDGLLAKGHRIAPSQSLGRVNAVMCREGLPSKPQTCSIEVDPRGAGLAVSADR
jgi:gamma-glutamyltranspeptidase / glutathione hydrolase